MTLRRVEPLPQTRVVRRCATRCPRRTPRRATSGVCSPPSPIATTSSPFCCPAVRTSAGSARWSRWRDVRPGTRGPRPGLRHRRHRLCVERRAARAPPRSTSRRACWSWRPPSRPARRQPRWVAGDMMALPFASGRFDVVTTGYGIRNVPVLPARIAEIHRVLKPGGLFLSLDFNRPSNALVRAVYLSYLTIVGSALGYALHRDPDTYRYIPESIRRYPGAAGGLRHAAGAGVCVANICPSWAAFWPSIAPCAALERGLRGPGRLPPRSICNSQGPRSGGREATGWFPAVCRLVRPAGPGAWPERREPFLRVSDSPCLVDKRHVRAMRAWTFLPSSPPPSSA